MGHGGEELGLHSIHGFKLVAHDIDGLCQLCRLRCPVEAVLGTKKEPHQIVQEKCIKCGACYDGCKFDAVAVD